MVSLSPENLPGLDLQRHRAATFNFLCDGPSLVFADYYPERRWLCAPRRKRMDIGNVPGGKKGPPSRRTTFFDFTPQQGVRARISGCEQSSCRIRFFANG